MEIDSSVSWDGTLNETVTITGDVEMDDGVVQVDVRAIEIVR